MSNVPKAPGARQRTCPQMPVILICELAHRDAMGKPLCFSDDAWQPAAVQAHIQTCGLCGDWYRNAKNAYASLALPADQSLVHTPIDQKRLVVLQRIINRLPIQWVYRESKDEPGTLTLQLRIIATCNDPDDGVDDALLAELDRQPVQVIFFLAGETSLDRKFTCFRRTRSPETPEGDLVTIPRLLFGVPLDARLQPGPILLLALHEKR